MQLNPILSFNGQCEAAFQCYETCLGGRISFMMRFGEAPNAAQAHPEQRDKIFHATLTLGNQILQGSDVPAEHYITPQGFTLRLNFNEPREAEGAFKALSEGGTVQMPLAETFWALRFGVLTDRFGIPWAISCEPQA